MALKYLFILTPNEKCERKKWSKNAFGKDCTFKFNNANKFEFIEQTFLFTT